MTSVQVHEDLMQLVSPNFRRGLEEGIGKEKERANERAN
jgi:hypothetical protein